MSTEQQVEPQHGVLLGQWVRVRRLALGLTGEQVAERMGPEIPGNYVSQLENGVLKRMVGQPRLGQLARALEVPEIDLIRAAGMITDESVVEDDSDLDDVVMFGAKSLTAEGKVLLREHLQVLRRHYGDLAEEGSKRNAR